jgi:hypothetical protein
MEADAWWCGIATEAKRSEGSVGSGAGNRSARTDISGACIPTSLQWSDSRSACHGMKIDIEGTEYYVMLATRRHSPRGEIRLPLNELEAGAGQSLHNVACEIPDHARSNRYSLCKIRFVPEPRVGPDSAHGARKSWPIPRVGFLAVEPRETDSFASHE